MNGDRQLAAQMQNALVAAGLTNVDVLVCPPFPYLGEFDSQQIKLGAQNLSEFDSGAHTGEISAAMLLDMGCQYVIVGHSERRADNSESNELVANKVARALQSGLTPILCVGESLEIRESGQLFDYLANQLDAVINTIGIEAFASLVVAYEPVWAIGTGKTASPEQAQEVHAFIRQHLAQKNAEIALKINILYGGSVKASNAAELFAQPDVDGGLIGGASLVAEDFVSICQAANS